MASLEEKFMGGRKDNYMSSSEDEDVDNGKNRPEPIHDGLPQTGPKGVIQDYKRFEESARLETDMEKRERMERMTREAKTCLTVDEEKKLKEREEVKKPSASDEAFMKEYRAKRLTELKEQPKAQQGPRRYFGNLVEIRGDKYAEVIDNAPKEALVIMHIYDEFLQECQLLNKSLTQLAKRYPSAKFCRVQAFQVQVSDSFGGTLGLKSIWRSRLKKIHRIDHELKKKNQLHLQMLFKPRKKDGIPALLVYKNSELIGNFLKVTDNLGFEFVMEDVETFLHDHNCLPSLFLQPDGGKVCKAAEITGMLSDDSN